MKPARNSLFAILLRKPWWISVGIAVVLGLIGSALFPRDQALLGFFAGFPFFVIGIIAAWRQRGIPNEARLTAMQQELMAMNWPAFSEKLEQTYRSKGYLVERFSGPGADFEIARGNQRWLVSCKRWKATSHGLEPLRELQAAAGERHAQAIYMAMAQPSENARRYIEKEGIELIDATGIALLLFGSR